MKTDPAVNERREPTTPAPRRRVLLVEDDDDLRKTLAACLRADGAELAEACNGGDAERMLLERPFDFDVLVTDIRMPGRTGLQLLRSLRERGSRIPVVLMSGFVDAAEPSGQVSPERTFLFAKPFDIDDLRTAIVNIDAYVGADPAPSPAPLGNVFLAEDDDDLRSLIGDALRNGGFVVQEARDGAAMIDLLETSFLRVPALPDAIVMDIRMPRCDGLDVLRALRLSRWNVPVILMTAFPDEDVLQSAWQLGAACLLPKPLDVDDLVAAVTTVTKLASSRRRP